MASRQFDFVDARTVRDQDGVEYDVLDALSALPWKAQLCPVMRHEYAILSKSPTDLWFALEAMVRLSPDSYRAFFRGYPRPNRYWDAPDGLRYWRGRFELDRSSPDSAEQPRRVDDGATAIKTGMGHPGHRTAQTRMFEGLMVVVANPRGAGPRVRTMSRVPEATRRTVEPGTGRPSNHSATSGAAQSRPVPVDVRHQTE